MGDFDWKSVAAMVGKVAPMLGTAIGGPVGGAVGTGISLLSKALGVEETPDAIMEAIKTDPTAYAKIKQAELDNTLALESLVHQTRQAEMENHAKIIESLNKADESGHSTRPKIAMFLTYAFLAAYVAIGIGIMIAIIYDRVDVGEMWATLGTYLGIPMTVIKMYFGDLRKEHAQSNGQQVDFGTFGNLLGKIK